MPPRRAGDRLDALQERRAGLFGPGRDECVEIGARDDVAVAGIVGMAGQGRFSSLLKAMQRRPSKRWYLSSSSRRPMS